MMEKILGILWGGFKGGKWNPDRVVSEKKATRDIWLGARIAAGSILHARDLR